MDTTTANRSFCPLCEGDNQCAIAGGKNAADCWCMSTPISPIARQAAAQVDNAGQRCLCQHCGQILLNSTSPPR